MYLCHWHPNCYSPAVARRRVIIRGDSHQQRLGASFQSNTYIMAEYIGKNEHSVHPSVSGHHAAAWFLSTLGDFFRAAHQQASAILYVI